MKTFFFLFFVAVLLSNVLLVYTILLWKCTVDPHYFSSNCWTRMLWVRRLNSDHRSPRKGLRKMRKICYFYAIRNGYVRKRTLCYLSGMMIGCFFNIDIWLSRKLANLRYDSMTHGSFLPKNTQWTKNDLNGSRVVFKIVSSSVLPYTQTLLSKAASKLSVKAAAL